MKDSTQSPRRLTRQWVALLLAPLAWAVALGVLFPLTKVACVSNTRVSLWSIVVACVVLALASAALAGHAQRGADGDQPGASADRMRFMVGVALGLSAIFSLVLLLMAVPILMLGACRT